MRTLSSILTLILVSCLVSHAEDITTLDGRKYIGATITRTEPDGLTIATNTGIIKIKFKNLPPELQHKYNYSPEAETKYKQEIVRARTLARAKFFSVKQPTEAGICVAEILPEGVTAWVDRTGKLVFIQDLPDDIIEKAEAIKIGTLLKWSGLIWEIGTYRYDGRCRYEGPHQTDFKNLRLFTASEARALEINKGVQPTEPALPWTYVVPTNREDIRVPPPSPTPSATPQASSIPVAVPQPSPYTWDANTLILEHFDNSVTGSVRGPFRYKKGVFGQAGDFESSTALTWKAQQMPQGTLEFWCRLTTYTSSSTQESPRLRMAFANYPNLPAAITLSVDIARDSIPYPEFAVNTAPFNWSDLKTRTKIDLNTWRHYAVSWGPLGKHFFVDGNEVASNTNIDGLNTSTGIIGLGSRVRFNEGLTGQIDEFRLSDIQRTFTALPDRSKSE